MGTVTAEIALPLDRLPQKQAAGLETICLLEGYSGVMDLAGEADAPLQKVGTPAAGMLSGLDEAQLARLREQHVI